MRLSLAMVRCFSTFLSCRESRPVRKMKPQFTKRPVSPARHDAAPQFCMMRR
jgi:hypothetical protein